MIRKATREYRGMIALYILLGLGAAAASTGSVRLFQMLIDRLSGWTGLAGVLPILAGYGLCALAEYLLNYAEEYPYNQLRTGLYQYLRRAALEKVSRIDYTAYQDIGTGRLIQLAESGASAGREILFEFYLRIAAQLLPGAVLSVMVIGIYDWRIMLGALSGYVLVFLITRLLLTRLYAIKEGMLVSEEWLTKTYVRAFMEMPVFRVNRRFRKEIERARKAGKEITDATTRMRMVHELFFVAFAILVLAIKLALVALAIGRIARGEMSVGVLLALLTLADRVYQPVAVFNVIYVDYKLNKIAWKRFDGFIAMPDDPNLHLGREAAVGRGEIVFEGVSFAYGPREILSQVDITIPGGETSALLGPSGSGKSTLVSLALGLNKPTKGRVLIDGQDIASLKLDSLYRHIAYLSQDAPIFDGTVRENIAFDDGAPDDALWEALAKANLKDTVEKMDKGLDTAVGEHGVKLSGGEKQRLAFARLFFQQPKVIILDEPTSALDRDTERAVIRQLSHAMPGRTIILIAHNEEAVALADHKILLEGGRVSAGRRGEG